MEMEIKLISTHRAHGQVKCKCRSTLSAILGEIECTAGRVAIQRSGCVPYTPQTPFIINATVRENVTLGLPYDEERYHAAIVAASLLHDLELQADGDLTEMATFFAHSAHAITTKSGVIEPQPIT